MGVFETVEEIIRQRRSNLHMDLGRSVPPELIERVCGLACWAPNHKRTHPWRFCVVTDDARARLGEVVARSARASGIEDEAVLQKLRHKYLRAPVVLIVSSDAHDDPWLHLENRDSVAAGIENVLLGATALGLATYWSTGAAAHDPAVKQLAGLGEEDQIVGIVYLGWAEQQAPVPKKPAPAIRWVS
jgi:nitroreductase